MLWAIAVASTGVVIGSLILALASDQLDLPGLRAFLIGWIVIPYVVSGILAWWRRPASRLGPLMVATGFGMAITPLQWSDQPLVYSIGHLFDMLPAALFLHVFLAFPTGRLTSKAERIVVVACYATVLGLQLVKVMLGANPDSVFALVDQPEIGNAVEQIQLFLVGVFLLTGAVLLYLRQRHAGQSHRRPAVLVVDAFDLALVMLAILYAAGLGAWPAFETIRLVTFASLGLAPIAFLFALLDARLARGEVANLLVELQRNPTADPQEPLTRALRDPSLRLAYWLPKSRSWADQNGEPTALPEADERRAVRVIQRDDEPMAAMVFDRALEDEYELLDAVAAAAGIALENGRLRAELRARLQELQGSRSRVLEVGRQERQRLERDLHDGAQQRLVALSLELSLIGQSATADPELKKRLARAKTEVSASLEELRDVAQGHLPSRPVESRPGHCTGVAGGSGSYPRAVDGRSRRPAARADGGGRLLRGQRGADQHRQARPCDFGQRAGLSRSPRHRARHQRRRGRRGRSGDRVRACVGWPIGWRRSAASSASRHPQAGARSSTRNSVSVAPAYGRDRGGQCAASRGPDPHPARMPGWTLWLRTTTPTTC